MDEFKERLRQLKEKRKIASHSNFKEVLEENERKKRPANWEKQLERTQKRLEEEDAKQRAEEAGQDYEIAKSLNYRADEIDKWEKIKGSKRAKAQDNGPVDFEEASRRQYWRSVKQLKPDMEEYEKLKRKVGEEKFYSGARRSTIGQATTSAAPAKSNSNPKTTTSAEVVEDSEAGIELMVETVHKEIEIRGKRSRRRRFDDEADVNYINERNMRFNQKLERFYGDYTDEIKKNFERGTAM